MWLPSKTFRGSLKAQNVHGGLASCEHKLPGETEGGASEVCVCGGYLELGCVELLRERGMQQRRLHGALDPEEPLVEVLLRHPPQGLEREFTVA